MRELIIIIATLCIVSCGNKADESKSRNRSQSKKETVGVNVDTLHLTLRTFNRQIVCNGKLRAELKSDINFQGTGTIAQINVKNGEYVEQGSLLATLDTEDATIELNQSIRSMEKARIDLVDKLIGQGYDADTTAVPQAILEYTKHSSGYNTAEDALLSAERALQQCYLKAPFSGRVANMDSKPYNATADLFCTLIDDDYFDVEFNILEAELSEVAVGEKITASPFVNDESRFDGYISEINPVVDDNGQIKVRAKVRNRDNKLLEGMNIKIVLNREIRDQYVVPKSAVVLRDGFNVIFRYIDGEAVWTYVDIVMSNIDSHLIRGNREKGVSLSQKDIIITSGNSNIADGTAVNIK